MRLSVAISVAALLGAVVAHPGEVEEHGTPARREFLSYAKRSIAGCQDKISARGIEERAIQRRSAAVEKLRAKNAELSKRDADSVLNTTHLSDKTGLTPQISGADLFTGDLSCVLQAEVTQGPYYVSGELIRGNVIECQKGVPLYADYQIINVNTCEPIPDVYVDSWHANATGVYSGVIAQGNGDSGDATNINATFLRGIQKTDSDGVAQFATIVPGHYTGRATHIHLMATINATVLPNNTLSGGNVAHVGQMFFDQDLLDTVQTVAPYNTNTQTVTLNSGDSIFTEEAASMDPVLEYVWLGELPTEGIFAWISIGIDPTSEYTISAAASLTRNGGVANPDPGMGSGNGGGPGGASPSGAMPSGSGGVPPSGSAGVAPTGSGVPPSGSGGVSPSGSAGAAPSDSAGAAPTDSASAPPSVTTAVPGTTDAVTTVATTDAATNTVVGRVITTVLTSAITVTTTVTVGMQHYCLVMSERGTPSQSGDQTSTIFAS